MSIVAAAFFTVIEPYRTNKPTYYTSIRNLHISTNNDTVYLTSPFNGRVSFIPRPSGRRPPSTTAVRIARFNTTSAAATPAAGGASGKLPYVLFVSLIVASILCV